MAKRIAVGLLVFTGMVMLSQKAEAGFLERYAEHCCKTIDRIADSYANYAGKVATYGGMAIENQIAAGNEGFAQRIYDVYSRYLLFWYEVSLNSVDRVAAICTNRLMRWGADQETIDLVTTCQEEAQATLMTAYGDAIATLDEAISSGGG